MDEKYYFLREKYDFIPAGTLIQKLEMGSTSWVACKILFCKELNRVLEGLIGTSGSALHSCGALLVESIGYNIPYSNLKAIDFHSLIGKEVEVEDELYGIVFWDKTDNEKPYYGINLQNPEEAEHIAGMRSIIGIESGWEGKWLTGTNVQFAINSPAVVTKTLYKRPSIKLFENEPVSHDEIKIIRKKVKLW